MDMENLNLRDKRNRFHVNKVDSVATEHHPNTESTTNLNGARLVGYKDFGVPQHVSDAESSIDLGRCDSPAKLINSNEYSSINYDTKYGKSFRHFTREALPRIDNYRNIMSIQAAYRPTLDELHDMTVEKTPSDDPIDKGEPQETGAVKFGWIKGVLVRCLLNIWGVMLFLRLSWCTGQAGIILQICVIILATAVTFLTGLSMSAISTNGQIKGVQQIMIILSCSVLTIITSFSLSSISTNGNIKGGGTYFMISRSLGPEFGASIGVIFSIANAVAVAMYTVGFAESLTDLLKSLGTYVVPDDMNSIRIIGTVAIIFLTGVVVVGMEWEASAQVVLLIILLAAMLDFVIGSFIGPLSAEELSKGFVGYNGTLFLENLVPKWGFYNGEQQSFFSVFSIFFPAATGILAGANISGDLKVCKEYLIMQLSDPQYSIPKGTILSIIVTTISYIIFCIIAGFTVVRDANGVWENITYEELQETQSYRDCYNLTNSSAVQKCEWGLMNSFQVMELVSIWGPLIYAGCFAATLSSALASLVSAPKVFQAVCNDKLYPYIEFFGKGYGKSNEPIRGYILTFVIALAFILIAELNAIAPLISNFFLAAYALINFSTFHATLAKPLGFRPTFKYYNAWLSFVGFVLCVAVMFLISWSTALLTMLAIFILYMIVIYRKPEVNWGSTTQALSFKNAITSVQDLNFVNDHVKNYRPQILVLSGLPSQRPPLVDYAHLISKNNSFIVCGHIIKGNVNIKMRNALQEKAQNWFQMQKIKSFYSPVNGMNFEDGANALLQASGLGKLKPNLLLVGYKHNWRTCNRDELGQYFNVLHRALDFNLSIAILRVEDGLDFSKKIKFGEEIPPPKPNELNKSKSSSLESIPRNQSLSQMSQMSTLDAGENDLKDKNKENMYRHVDGGVVPKPIMDSLMRFQRKCKHGIIDVWWLYDDGGLTLLMPYIMKSRSNWSTCKLRVFTLANKASEFDQDQRKMAELLAKFRIDYSDLIVIPDINKKPLDSTVALFNDLVSDFKQKYADEDTSTCISDSEFTSLKEKSNRHMRLRELLLEHSRTSSMVFMTLPIPKKGRISSPLYMAYLELLTKDLPGFVLVRGNQQSVLTFYS